MYHVYTLFMPSIFGFGGGGVESQRQHLIIQQLQESDIIQAQPPE